jgi:hypothetical protein
VAADRIRSLKPTAVNAILAEVRQLQAEGKKLNSLMRSEPDFTTPAHIREALVHGADCEGTLCVPFASGGENLQVGLEKLRAGLAAQR